MRVEFNHKVLGGLPVTISACVQKAEPDVGIMGDYVDEWDIVKINDRVCRKSPEWIYERINKRKGEEDEIIRAALEHGFNRDLDYCQSCI